MRTTAASSACPAAKTGRAHPGDIVGGEADGAGLTVVAQRTGDP
ncbi:hypothetical protein [Streptomyces sp. NPDC017448]